MFEFVIDLAFESLEARLEALVDDIRDLLGGRVAILFVAGGSQAVHLRCPSSFHAFPRVIQLPWQAYYS